MCIPVLFLHNKGDLTYCTNAQRSTTKNHQTLHSLWNGLMTRTWSSNGMVKTWVVNGKNWETKKNSTNLFTAIAKLINEVIVKQWPLAQDRCRRNTNHLQQRPEKNPTLSPDGNYMCVHPETITCTALTGQQKKKHNSFDGTDGSWMVLPVGCIMKKSWAAPPVTNRSGGARIVNTLPTYGWMKAWCLCSYL